MRVWGKFGRISAAAGASFCASGAAAAWADEVYGHAVPGEIGFQPTVTEVGRDIDWLHNVVLLPMTIAISLLVLGLLAYVVWRFNEKANPTPSKTTHNAFIETVWTIVPVLLLVMMAIPSFRLLTKELVIPTPDLTVKVTGYQWHWEYTYPKEQGGFTVASYIKEDKDLKPEDGDIRLLSVDNQAVVPVGKVVRFEVTASDVIHSFVVQAFGIRIDAVPGRLNETWFKAEREGLYYGQCSKICGKDHAFMPIVVRVVSDKDYQAWLADAQKKFSAADSPVQIATTAAPAGQ